MGLPTAILFDLDDTLISAHLHPRKAWTKALQTVGGLPGDPTAEEAAVAIHTSAKWYWSDAERHRIGRLDILTARKTILTRAFTEIGWAQDDDFIDRLGRHFTEQRTNDTKLFPDAVETLDGLAQRGVRLGLITNGNAIEQRAKVDRFELARHFHHIQIEGRSASASPRNRPMPMRWTSWAPRWRRPGSSATTWTGRSSSPSASASTRSGGIPSARACPRAARRSRTASSRVWPSCWTPEPGAENANGGAEAPRRS